jgi:hypothetical protein
MFGRWVAPIAIASSCMAAAAPAVAWDLEPPMKVATGRGSVAGMRVADLNGDGLMDIVVLKSNPPTAADPTERGSLQVLLQHASGFRMARSIDVVKASDLEIANVTPNPGLEILYRGWGALHVVELRADGTFRDFTGPGMDDHTLVDVDQDGYDDMFRVVGDGREHQYTIDYTRTLRTGNGTWFYRWSHYVGAPFGNAMGFPNGWSFPAESGIDLDADGYYDALEGRCNTACFFRQEPYGKLTATPLVGDFAMDDPSLFVYGDIDGDGLPDRISVGVTTEVQLQVAPLNFVAVGRIYGWDFTAPGIADIDLDGLTDLLIPQDATEVNIMLQQSPGTFRRVRLRAGGSSPTVADFDNDGCPDLLLNGQGWIEIHRGYGCVPRDIAVAAQVVPNGAVVTATHARGDVNDAQRYVRVVISPALQDDSALQMEVTPPPQCVAREARAPRRMFDCVMLLEPHATEQFEFGIRMAEGKRAHVHVNALLLDEAGDVRRDNNRVHVDAVFAHANGSSDTLPETR